MTDVFFHGEVSAVTLGVDTATLSKLIGLEAGVPLHPEEPWLHFTDGGKELFIAKRPLRSTISWNEINEVGAVDGTAKVEIAGKRYAVRLLSGVVRRPGINEVGFDTVSTHGSEWNRLMYRIHGGVHTDPKNRTNSNDLPKLAAYSDSDLLTYATFGQGSRTWCSDDAGGDYRVIRGYSGVSNIYRDLVTSSHFKCGWRPVLELLN